MRLGKLLRKTEGLIQGRYKIIVMADGTGTVDTGTTLPEGALYALEAEEGFGTEFTLATAPTNLGAWVLSYSTETGPVAEVTPSTYGDWYDGRMWYEAPIPEPTEEYDGEFVYTPEYTYSIADFGYSGMYDGDASFFNTPAGSLYSPDLGILLNTPGYAAAPTSEYVYQADASGRPVQGAVHYPGAGQYAWGVINRTYGMSG